METIGVSAQWSGTNRLFPTVKTKPGGRYAVLMSKRFTIQDVKNLAAAGKVRTFNVTTKKPVLPIINMKGKLKSKFGNEKVVLDDIEFDSRKEAKRYGELKLLIINGKIGWLELQVPYRFKIEGQKISAYIADFRYLDADTGNVIVEDVKSVATRKLPVYRMKKKLMKSIYGIDIQEI
jgi:hypothetical protein